MTATTSSQLALALALCLSGVVVPVARAVQGNPVIHAGNVEVRYIGHVSGKPSRRHYSREIWGSLYKAVWVRRAHAPAHLLRADPEYGYFLAGPEVTVSPNGQYLVLEQLQGGVATDGEHSWWHEVSSCAFVQTRNARLITQETGELCGGEFAAGGTWVSGGGNELNLAELAK